MLHLRLFALFACLAFGAPAQWINFRTPGTPRTREGKPDMTAPVPRTADGRPDLSGVWMHEITPLAEMKRLFGKGYDAAVQVDVPGMELGTQHKYAFNILLDFPPGESPMRPAAAAIQQRLASERAAGDVCSAVAGIPVADLLSEPMKFVQSPRLSVILYEVGNEHRQIYMDGRTLPREFDLSAYLGYSVGHWEGDVLIVETAGFNAKTSLDLAGHPHSEALHVIERYQRRDFGHLDLEMTFDDPQMYARPFTIKVPHELLADADIFESVCNENEKDRVHLGKN